MVIFELWSCECEGCKLRKVDFFKGESNMLGKIWESMIGKEFWKV